MPTIGSQQSSSVRNFTILIHRDYRDGPTVKFNTIIPDSLKSYISAHIFFETMTDINEIFAEAEYGTSIAYFEGYLAFLTGNILYFLCGSQYDRKLVELKEYINFINGRVYNTKGLEVEDPTYRGFRELGITTL